MDAPNLNHLQGLHGNEPNEQVEVDQDTSELSDLANSILVECKQAAPLSALDTAIWLLREALTLRPEPNFLRSYSLNDLAATLVMRFWHAEQHQDLHEAVLLFTEASNLRKDGMEPRTDPSNGSQFIERPTTQLCPLDEGEDQESTEMIYLANSTLNEFVQAAQVSSLDTAISLHRDALGLLDGTHAKRSASLNGLALTLSARFYRTGVLQDLDEAILLHREALTLLPDSCPDRLTTLNNFSAALLTRFGKTAQDVDLHDAVSLHNEAICTGLGEDRSIVRKTESDRESQRNISTAPAQGLAIVFKTERGTELYNFAIDTYEQFQRTGQLSDLETAISLYQEALIHLPTQHPTRPCSLNNLASALDELFQITGQSENTELLIALHREALKLRPAPHPDRFTSLNNLGNVLRSRYVQTDDIKYADEAIALLREALKLSPASYPRRSQSLNNLAHALAARFRRTSYIEDADEAVVLHREALRLRPAPHPNRWNSLSNLASLLYNRFEKTYQPADLKDTIALYREALGLQSFPNTNRLRLLDSLNGLAIALVAQFGHASPIEDVDEAIALHREALELQPASHPDRLGSLSNLANVLDIRFSQLGRIEDVAEAITLHREALNLRPISHPDRPESLNNLAIVLNSQFQQTKHIGVIHEVVALHREALDLRPTSHPDRPESLNNLASSLGTRYCLTGRIEDADDAITLHREALELRPASHPDRPESLNNLAIVLGNRFDQTGNVKDVDEAIGLLREALELRPMPNPYRLHYLNNLACALMSRYQSMQQSSDLECAIDAFRESVGYEYAPASQRFIGAETWISCVDAHSKHALEAYQAAIGLLPRIVTLDLDLQSRHRALTSGTDGLSRRAAACAIHCGEYSKAITLLEEGRSIFWSQGLQLRTQLDDLESTAPSLFKTFKDLSRALEQGSQREASWSLSTPLQKRMSTEKEAIYFRNLNRDWLSALERIRNLDGFRDFLLPTSFDKLQKAAAHGPVVILNASDTGCAALVMMPLEIVHVPLPRCSLESIGILVEMVQIACGARSALVTKWQIKILSQKLQDLPHETQRDDRSGAPAGDIAANPDEIFQGVLAILWTSVVQPIFRSLDLKKTDSPHRLWWCPTGLFSFLPIHAAGFYNVEGAESVFDYVVSSYTPSLKPLLGDQPSITDQFELMVVIQPTVPNGNPLPSTKEELQNIRNHVPSNFLVTLGVENAPATVQEVLSHLSSSHVVHFACHGKQDAMTPLESGLILHNGEKLRINEIMKQPMPNASLAFLSACETAMGAENLPDEAMHLAASLLFAGFRGVVATLWSIADEDGPKVAESFYSYLFRETVSGSASTQTYPDLSDAARALHNAVGKLRVQDKCSFRRWVPFIHMGL